MNKTHCTVLASALVAVLSFAPIAEAKRAGGGKGMGMSRNTSQPVQQRQAQPAQQQQAQQQQASPQQAAPANSGPGIGSMVAAGAVGAVAGSMAANAMADKDPAADPNAATAQATDAPVVDQAATQAPAIASETENKPNFLMWLFLAAIAFFAFRSFGKKKA